MTVKESISIVIPAYNESLTVEVVAKEALGQVRKLTADYEIVLVDDGSTDGTSQIIDKLARENRRIRTVHHKKNKGFTGAMRTAFKSAEKQLIFLAPADGQFDFSQLGKFTKALPEYDAVVGYRVRNEEGFARKLNSRMFHFLCRYLLNIKLREISSVSLWRREVVQKITVKSEDRSAMFLPEIISKALKKNYKFAEVPIRWYERKGGQPKGGSPMMILKTLKQMFKLWVKVRA